MPEDIPFSLITARQPAVAAAVAGVTADVERRRPRTEQRRARTTSNRLRTGPNIQSAAMLRGQSLFAESLRSYDINFAVGMDAVSACNRKTQGADTIVCSHDPEKLVDAVHWFWRYVGVTVDELAMTIEVRPGNGYSDDELLLYWSEALGVPRAAFGKPVRIETEARRPCDDRRAHFGALQMRFRKRVKTAVVLGIYRAKRDWRARMKLTAGRLATADLFDMVE